MTEGKRWYVVLTQPNGEARAQANLARQGFAVYLPRFRRIRRHARKIEVVARPLFPRYMFVSLDLARDRWRVVQSTFGIQSLILAGDRPGEIADDIIGAIQEREDAEGFVQLSPVVPLSKGNKVRILDGIFEDAIGVFERVADKRRVAVLLQLLGREVLTLIPNDSIAAA